MKKNLKLLTIGVILTLCAGFASCGGGSSSSSSPSGSTSTSTSTSSSTPAPTQLSAPENIEFYSNDAGRFLGFQYILNWDDVDKAEGYIVSIGDEEIETEDSECDLYDYVTVGQEVTVTVKAKGDGEKYLDSDDSSHTCLPKYATKGLSYEHSGADGGMLASLGTCTDKNIVFPERASGSPVVGVAKEGFLWSEIESVTITNSITIIHIRAFQQCMQLKNVIFEEESQLKILENAAFGHGVLETITLPKLVETVEMYALGTQLKSVFVDEENPFLCSVDGVLYSKDKTKLILYPSQKEDEEYVILDTVKTIQSIAIEKNNFLKKIVFPKDMEVIDAFHPIIFQCEKLEEIVLPQKLKEVGGLLVSCENLKHITIPDGVQKIKESVVVGLFERSYVIPNSVTYMEDSLEKTSIVYYKGTEQEWNNILPSKNRVGTIYFYSEDEPEEEGNFWHYNSEGEIEVWG